MSRGFVKEGDQEEVPYVPQRAYLPAGVTNYVTPGGMAALLVEKDALIKEREQLTGINENDRRVSVNFVNAKLGLLEDRIRTARVIKLSDQPQDEIRFGATVELVTSKTGEIQILQITGVDEADASKGKISFISPMAKALINKRVGDNVTFKRPAGVFTFLVKKIGYQ